MPRASATISKKAAALKTPKIITKAKKQATKTIKKAPMATKKAAERASKKIKATCSSFSPGLALHHGSGFMPRMGFGTSLITDASIIESAIRVGYRHLDTASFYDNEAVVGEAIQNCITAGVVQRGDLFITTKMWHTEYQDPEAAIRRSLKRLGLKYVDMYLVHWPNNGFSAPTVPMHILWPRIEALQHKGLTNSIGVSNFNVQFLADMLTYCKIKPACNQIEIHPKLAQMDLIRFLKDKGIVPVAYSPLGRGHLLADGAKNIVDDDLILSLAAKYGKEPT